MRRERYAFQVRGWRRLEGEDGGDDGVFDVDVVDDDDGDSGVTVVDSKRMVVLWWGLRVGVVVVVVVDGRVEDLLMKKRRWIGFEVVVNAQLGVRRTGWAFRLVRAERRCSK